MPIRPENKASESRVDVPCGKCTNCCKGDAVRLLPGDGDRFEFETEPHPRMTGELMLAHKSNGDCVYLTAQGCSIHEFAPRMCREMDCRKIAKALTWTQARKMVGRGEMKMIIWQRGKELLRQS